MYPALHSVAWNAIIHLFILPLKDISFQYRDIMKYLLLSLEY